MHRLQRLTRHVAAGHAWSCQSSVQSVATHAAAAVEDFLAAPAGFAVVGASAERRRFGNQVLRCYMQHGLSVVPVSIKQKVIEGLPAVASLRELGREVKDYGVSVITPPKATLELLEVARDLGVRRIWLQPGSESPEVLKRASELDMGLIHSGPCLLQVLGFDSTWSPPEAVAEGSSESGALQWRIDGKQVLTLTLTAPQKRNTLSVEVLSTLQERLKAVKEAERGRVRAVLLQAQGNVFSSGHDFGDFAAEKGRQAHERTLKMCSEVNMLLQEIPQPTIAVVQGLATAAGCQLACSCDLVLAADSAAFQLPGAASGGFCHTPAVSVAARAASLRFAVEMALLAERVPAQRAERMGLVNRVVPRVALFQEARAMAEKIAAIEPEHLQRGKLLLYEQAAKSTLAEKYATTEPAMLDMFASDASQAKVKKFVKPGK